LSKDSKRVIFLGIRRIKFLCWIYLHHTLLALHGTLFPTLEPRVLPSHFDEGTSRGIFRKNLRLIFWPVFPQQSRLLSNTSADTQPAPAALPCEAA
jgi:hypothetical protein